MTEEEDITVRFTRSHSHPELQIRAEALNMCIQIMDSVSLPHSPAERSLWLKAMACLLDVLRETQMNDHAAKRLGRGQNEANQ